MTTLNQSPVDYKISDGIAIISLNHPPVNSLGHALRSAIKVNLDRAVDDPDVSAILVTGNDAMFSAGADITEFDSGPFWEEPALYELCNHLEACPKLLVFALNGTTMGGALELALTGDYRLAAPGALLGQPEVTLGIIPGAGATQRLPRRIDPKVALDMIVTGKPITAEKTRELGLVDLIAEAEANFRAAAINYVQSLLQENAPRRRCPDLPQPENVLTEEYLSEFRQAMAKQLHGFYAPEQAILAVEAACRLPLSEGLDYEMDRFKACIDTPQHRAQKHLFFAERAAKKIPGVTKDHQPRRIDKVGVIGSGTMGGGISMSFLAAGIPVILVDISDEALQKGLDRIKSNYAGSVKRGRLSQEQVDRQLSLLQTTTEYAPLSDADLVIEAVFEKFDLKEKVFRELDQVCKAGAVLASNTSTLDLNRLAGFTSRPSDVVGMHFFSPANIMRLLEVVRGEQTAPDVLATVLEVARRVKKLPIVVGVCYGFVGNRMLEPYMREAQRLVLEGAEPAQVDRVLSGFGLAMGPITMMDMIGLDVLYLMREGNRDAIAHDASYAVIGDELYKMGRYGQKTGRGYYVHEGRKQEDDPELTQMAERLAGELGVERHNIEDKEILERCLYPLIDEGACILEEGIAYRSGDIDLIYTNGYGFPVWRGGPMHYAGEIGLEPIVTALNHYREALGEYGEMWFRPSELSTKLAAAGQMFTDYEEQSK
ncbi:MAG: 3-hydroxyacyl-CoA dehydrogenase NAD-binding domain-containing protein [Gammaproteobacteria bacterium]